MKKQILISLILLSSVLTMNAQIRVPNDEISPIWYYNNKVGIGVTNPNAKFEVGVNHAWNQDEEMRIGSYYNNNFYGVGFNYRLDGNGSPSNHIVSYYGGIRYTAISIQNDKIGIGITYPNAKLEINGNLKLLDTEVPSWGLGFGVNGDPTRFLSVDVINSALQDDPLELVYSRGIGVKIGKDNSDNKYLKVFGLIEAKEIKVLSNINSDFVFESNYKLKPLSDVESFIMKNKHLPDVPSAKEFKEKGQNLAEVDDLLLRKIEELTLYTIEQNKELQLLKEKIAILEAASK